MCLCAYEIVAKLVNDILREIMADKTLLNSADLLSVEEDLLRLNNIARSGGHYEKGMTQDSLDLIFEKIAYSVERKKLPHSTDWKFSL